MNKDELISEIVADMNEHLNEKQLDILRAVMIIDMKNVEVIDKVALPSNTVYNNLWILQRYTVDLVATNHAEGTIKQYIRCMQKFFDRMNILFSAATSEDIMTYLALRQMQDKIAPNTKLGEYKKIKAFYKWCYNKSYIPKDITLSVDKIKEIPKKKERLTDEEVEKIRLSIPLSAKRDRALFELLMSCGVRLGEVVSIDIENIDFNNNEISIWGEKTQTWRVGFLTTAAKIAIKEYIGDRTKGALFLNKRNGNRLSSDGIEKSAKYFGELVNAHIKTTVHTFRKTFASQMYKKTGDILLVAKLLGHTTTNTTVKYYLIEDIDDMKYRVNKVR